MLIFNLDILKIRVLRYEFFFFFTYQTLPIVVKIKRIISELKSYQSFYYLRLIVLFFFFLLF